MQKCQVLRMRFLKCVITDQVGVLINARRNVTAARIEKNLHSILKN